MEIKKEKDILIKLKKFNANTKPNISNNNGCSKVATNNLQHPASKNTKYNRIYQHIIPRDGQNGLPVDLTQPQKTKYNRQCVCIRSKDEIEKYIY